MEDHSLVAHDSLVIGKIAAAMSHRGVTAHGNPRRAFAV